RWSLGRALQLRKSGVVRRVRPAKRGNPYRPVVDLRLRVPVCPMGRKSLLDPVGPADRFLLRGQLRRGGRALALLEEGDRSRAHAELCSRRACSLPQVSSDEAYHRDGPGGTAAPERGRLFQQGVLRDGHVERWRGGWNSTANETLASKADRHHDG